MIFAFITIAVLVLIGLLHVYWAMGGRAGITVAIPEFEGRSLFRPGPSLTFMVALLLFFAAMVVAIQAGMIFHEKFGLMPRAATIVLALVFAARAIGDFRYVGFFKRVTGTRFAKYDTLCYSPLCALLSLGLAITASHR
ncbi:MAG TPA: DUF3995 domain-containing protein [Candidatus Angelobacter sp.]|nr:DUF3995 domain-containing protein [Candidatus Angelobacter sp.]